MPDKIIKRSAPFVFIMVFGGCGLLPITPGHWTYPSNSQATIKEDHFSCIKEAWEQYPTKMGYISAENGHLESARNATSECSYSKYTKKTSCTYTPATSAQWISADIIKGDENAKSRSDAYANCMTSKNKDYKCIRNGEEVHGSWCGNYKD